MGDGTSQAQISAPKAFGDLLVKGRMTTDCTDITDVLENEEWFAYEALEHTRHSLSCPLHKQQIPLPRPIREICVTVVETRWIDLSDRRFAVAKGAARIRDFPPKSGAVAPHSKNSESFRESALRAKIPALGRAGCAIRGSLFLPAIGVHSCLPREIIILLENHGM